MKKVSALLLLLVVVGCTKRDSYLTIPASACKQQYTGKTSTDYVITYQCFSYNKDGGCSTNVPVTQPVEYKQVRTTCDHTEWK